MKKREIKKEWNSEREIKEETNRIKSWNERSKQKIEATGLKGGWFRKQCNNINEERKG